MATTKTEAARYVARAIGDGIVPLTDDVTVGAGDLTGTRLFAVYVDRGRNKGRYDFLTVHAAARAFVDFVGADEAVAAVDRAYLRRDGEVPARVSATARYDDVLAQAGVRPGARVVVVKGSRGIGIDKGVTLAIENTTVLPESSMAVAVRFMAMNGSASGQKRVLYARHPNRLSDADVSLASGNGADKIVVRVSRPSTRNGRCR
jgi:hypothetical protein